MSHNNCCLKVGQIFIVAAILANMAGCSSSVKDTLSCHYEPIRGTVVKVSKNQPAQVSFTPDSAADESWFKRFKVDMERLGSATPPSAFQNTVWKAL